MGYCCFQSALVFINQLARSDRNENNKSLEKLKVLFTFLGTLRKFFTPACQWVRSPPVSCSAAG